MPDARRRNAELLQKFFEQTLSENEGCELLTLWRQQPELKRESQANHRLETLLQFLARIEKEPISHGSAVLHEELPFFHRNTVDLNFLDELVRLAAESPSNVVERPKPTKQSTPSSKSKPEKPSAWPKLVAFCACMALFLSVIYFQNRPPMQGSKHRTFRPIAKVESVLDVQWNDEATALREGQQLESEVIRFRSGIVQLQLSNGVRLALTGPADFRLNTARKVFCGEGELSVTVPPSGKGFEVVTPFLSVIDLGTEFFLDIKDDRLDVHTVRGKIELNREANEKIELTTGGGFGIDAAGLTKHFNAEPNRFLTDLFVSALQEKRSTVEFEQWKTERDRWLSTPGLRMFFDAQNDGRPGVERGRVSGARHCEGRWQGKKAYLFIRKADSVGFEIPGEMRSMTLFASLRLDALDRYNQVILASRSMEPGSVIWQILGDGSVQLAIRAAAGESVALYQTPPVFTTRNLGTWVRLETVLDAEKREVRFSLDGEVIEVFPIKVLRPIRIGNATLGNLVPEKRSASDTSLDGRIDQLMIFDRAL